MAAAYVPYNKDLDPMRSAKAALLLIKQGVTQLGNARAIMIQLCDGATNVAANFAELTSVNGFTAGGYADANTAAMAAFTQIDSVYQKITAQAGDATGAAIDQAAGILGVV